MPSPFPGVDPFIEGQRWPDFHGEFVRDLRAALVPLVAPAYAALVDERVYLEHQPEGMPPWFEPDVALAKARDRTPRAAGGTATLEAPATVRIAMPERRREAYIELRLREGGELVTVIELLSPTNKRAGSDGYREYRTKRDAVLMSDAHLVEIDLLRGGARLAMVDPLPPGDYYVIVSRASRRPASAVWFWTLRDALPQVRIPLRGSDPDVEIDLQQVFNSAYDRAGYSYSLQYEHDVAPALNQEERAWVRERLAARPRSNTSAAP